MAQRKLEEVVKEPFGVPVYYFASTEEAMLRAAAAYVKKALLENGADSEVTRLDGPAPDMGEVIASAGAISFFGTPRVVELREIQPSSVKDKDAEELAELFGQLENAVLVVTALYKDKKAATSKKAKALFDAAAQAGYAQELAKPGRRENLDYLARQAATLGASFAHGAAEALLDSAGEDRALLASETEKLAAICGYGAITTAAVEQFATHNIEADVFELARYITGGNRAAAQKKLGQLLALKHEPIAIAAALAGTFVDMYRVRVGTEARQAVATIFKEMGYRGNDYRLKKAKETAGRYSPRRLEDCVLCLEALDKSLKSSALPDKSVLLQTAVGQLLVYGERR